MHLMQTAFIYYAVLSMVEGGIGFDQRCPRSNEWHSRRKNCTSPDKPFYACLYNEFSLQYSENCTRKEYKSRKGKKGVFSPAISETDCADSRFQPIKFTTLSYSDCIYAKSTCSEEGQVLAKNGSSFVDRSCRCDYRKGYNYITQPKDKCSCTPSLEDCSCYLTNCTGNSALTQDYDCVLKIDSRSGSYVCEKILNGSPANATTNTNNTFIDKKEHSSSSSFTALTSILIFMSIIVVSILMLWVSLSIRVMPHIVESKGISNGIIYIEEGIPKIYHHIEGDNFTITCDIMSRKLLPVKSVRWQKDGCNINLKSYKHELNDHDTSLTIENLSENDTGTYTCIVSNWLGFNNTSVDKCICHLSALHSRMKWIQTIHRFQACKREEHNRIAVNIHKLPELWKEEEKKIGAEVKMDPSTYKNKELMKPSEFVKSVVWFHLSKDIIRVVKQVQFVDINDRYLKPGQQSDKHIGTFKTDQYGEAVKSKQKGDTKDGTVRADQQNDSKKGVVKPDEHGDATEYAVKVDNNDDTKDRTYKPGEHGDLKNEGVRGDTQVKTVRLYQREDTKEGAVKAGKQGDAKDDAVKEVDYDDTKDGTGKQNDYVDGKDEGVIAKQQSDKKEKSVRLDQHGDAKKVPVKADEQGDTKDKTVRADQHDDKKDGTDKPDEHGDKKDGGIKRDVSDDEGTWDRIALTFNTTFSDNGQYVCVLVGNGNVICIGWRLKVIPEGNVCRELMDHREDESYVKTSPVNDAMQCLENDGFVVITGREGTGKSKMKLQLVSLFQEKDFLPFEVNEKSLYKSLKDDLKTTKVIFLIDHIVYDPNGLDKMLEQLPDVSKNRQKKIVFTCRNVDLSMVKSILQRNKLYNTKACIDLDNILTVDDKRNILENHMKVSNKSETHSNDTEINNIDYLKPVELEENDILEIIKTEPFTGFPLMASNFCSDRKHFNKGKKYFTNPPTYLLNEIHDLYQSSLEKKETELMKEYCVLVYLATNERLCLDESDCSTSKFHQLSTLIYKGKKEVNYYDKNSIKDAADQLVAKKKYIIKSDDHTYRFIHPYVSKAILLLSEKLLDYFIENGDVEDIMEFVRSYKYNVTEDELVLRVTEDKYAILCERLILVMTKQSEKENKIGHYIYDCFIYLKDTTFLNALLSKVGCDPSLITMQTESSTEVDIKESKNNKDDRQTVMNAYQTPTSYNFDKKQNKSEEAPPIIFYSPPQMIALIEHLTRTGKDPWIYEQIVPDFVVLYGLIVGCKNNFLGVAEEKKTFNIILQMFTKNLERKKFRLQCCSPMDIFDNKFCHFLTLFNELESCSILKRLIECLNYVTKDTIIRGIQKKTERQNILKSKNIFEHSPLQMAAYLGKAKVFTDFSSESKKKKVKKEKLCEVVKNGMGGASVASRFADLNFDHELGKAICVGDTNAYKDIYEALKKW